MPGYQASSIRIETTTHDGQPVTWRVDFTAKTVTPMVGGVELGTFPSRTAAKAALQLVDVRTRT